MEGLAKVWKQEEEEAEVEEESLLKRQAPHHTHVTSTTVATSKIEVQATEQTMGSSGLKEEQEIIQTEVDSGDILKKTDLHPLDPTFFSSLRTKSERVGIITQNVQQENELHLEGLYQKTPTQGFYCPNCRTCIQKVLILDTVREEPRAPPLPPPQPSTFRCSSCFSFLIPLGSWLFPRLVHDPDVSTIPVQSPETPQITVQTPDQAKPTDGSGKIILKPDQAKPTDGADKSSSEQDDKTSDSSSSSSEIPKDEHDLDGSKGQHSLGRHIVDGLPKKDKVEEGRTEIPLESALVIPTEPDEDQEPGSSATWEILKSIVYGGLVESIASLGIVTSSASSDATTLNILVLSLANLIGGLFITIHNIWDMKSEQPRTSNETNSRYYEVLGKRKHFYLHVFMAILSFIIFGLVPCNIHMLLGPDS